MLCGTWVVSAFEERCRGLLFLGTNKRWNRRRIEKEEVGACTLSYQRSIKYRLSIFFLKSQRCDSRILKNLTKRDFLLILHINMAGLSRRIVKCVCTLHVCSVPVVDACKKGLHILCSTEKKYTNMIKYISQLYWIYFRLPLHLSEWAHTTHVTLTLLFRCSTIEQSAFCFYDEATAISLFFFSFSPFFLFFFSPSSPLPRSSPGQSPVV